VRIFFCWFATKTFNPYVSSSNNMLSTLYKIIGVCPQIFDSVIHDWLEPSGPLKAPSQSEGRWSREWKRAKWCSYLRWCHKAFPFCVLKVVSLVPYVGKHFLIYFFQNSINMPHGNFSIVPHVTIYTHLNWTMIMDGWNQYVNKNEFSSKKIPSSMYQIFLCPNVIV